MLLLLVLIASTLILRAISLAGMTPLDNWTMCLRGGLALMFLLTGASHWGRVRRDLIAMVPRFIRHPGFVVSLTGVLEIIGAIGLVPPVMAPVAAVCLAVLLIAMFPANVRAAREHLKVGDTPALEVPVRAFLQLVFLGGLVVAGFPSVLQALFR